MTEPMTKIPWHQEGDFLLGDDMLIATLNSGTPFTDGRVDMKRMRDANAAYIVKSANAFPELRAAVGTLLTEYVTLVESGDCGNWDADQDDFVIAARELLERMK